MDGAEDQLSAVFAALADPTRRAILDRLASGDSNVTELWAPFAISQPAISRHLKVLEQAGLISRTKQGTARLSHLEAEPLLRATDWLARYREFWTESYDRLDALLSTLTAPYPATAASPKPASPAPGSAGPRTKGRRHA